MTGAFDGIFADPDGTFTVSFDPATGIVTAIEDGEVTTFGNLAEFQSENPAVSREIAEAIDLVESGDPLEINPATGLLDVAFTDTEGTFTLFIDPETGTVTETRDGETTVYESLEAFLTADNEGDNAAGGVETSDGDLIPF